uniref:Protein kinase domain-containing protein n=1 Tax=Rhizophagus irregularis (strain DAOM 181602 / DAOM 197198 / MUCL 43194) TaxID=747089 RepID=U9UQD9_RHIID
MKYFFFLFHLLCLHDEEIVHRDLHSCNVLVHRQKGSMRHLIRKRNYLICLPKVLMNNNNLKLDKKSDVYSIDVLFEKYQVGNYHFMKR